jgi:hypothetical protein
VAGRVLEGEPDFDAFWEATVTPDRWKKDQAENQWNRLTPEDRLAIGRLMGPRGINLDGSSVFMWLKLRRWGRQQLAQDSEPEPYRTVELRPGTREWKAERYLKRSRGEDTTFMETQAKAGKSWFAHYHAPKTTA